MSKNPTTQNNPSQANNITENDEKYKKFFYNTENLENIYNILKGEDKQLKKETVKRLIQDFEGVEYDDIKEEKPIYELLNKIGNPLQRMKNVIRLLKNVIKNLQKYLSEENNEKDYTTYFITNKNQIERRENDFLKKTQEHLVTKILGEDKKEINDQINNKEIKEVQL